MQQKDGIATNIHRGIPHEGVYPGHHLPSAWKNRSDGDLKIMFLYLSICERYPASVLVPPPWEECSRQRMTPNLRAWSNGCYSRGSTTLTRPHGEIIVKPTKSSLLNLRFLYSLDKTSNLEYLLAFTNYFRLTLPVGHSRLEG